MESSCSTLYFPCLTVSCSPNESIIGRVYLLQSSLAHLLCLISHDIVLLDIALEAIPPVICSFFISLGTTHIRLFTHFPGWRKFWHLPHRISGSSSISMKIGHTASFLICLQESRHSGFSQHIPLAIWTRLVFHSTHFHSDGSNSWWPNIDPIQYNLFARSQWGQPRGHFFSSLKCEIFSFLLLMFLFFLPQKVEAEIRSSPAQAWEKNPSSEKNTHGLWSHLLPVLPCVWCRKWNEIGPPSRQDQTRSFHWMLTRSTPSNWKCVSFVYTSASIVIWPTKVFKNGPSSPVQTLTCKILLPTAQVSIIKRKSY